MSTPPLASYPVVRAVYSPVQTTLGEGVGLSPADLANLAEAVAVREAVEHLPEALSRALQQHGHELAVTFGEIQQAETDRVVASLEDSVASLQDSLEEVTSAIGGLTAAVEQGFAQLASLSQYQVEALQRIEETLLRPLDVRNRERRDRGLKAYERGLLDEARQDLQAAVETNVYDHVAWLHLASMFRASG